MPDKKPVFLLCFSKNIEEFLLPPALQIHKKYKSIDMSAGVLLQRFVVRIWTNLVLNNWVLTVILAVLLTALILKKRKQSFAAAEMLVVFWGYSVYSIFHRICPEWIFDGNQAVDRGIMALLSMLFFINVLL